MTHSRYSYGYAVFRNLRHTVWMSFGSRLWSYTGVTGYWEYTTLKLSAYELNIEKEGWKRYSYGKD